MYKVLIVEDDPMVAIINEHYVKKSKHFSVIGKCRDGQSALSLLEDNEVNLVIMDVYMPSLNEIETLHEIRKRQHKVDAIMVTAANDRDTLEEALHLGVVDYLVKPFDYNRFKMALDKYILHAESLKNIEILNQQNIDYIIDNSRQMAELSHPKGIQKSTLDIIKNYIQNSGDEWLSSELIAEGTGFSIVTVRRYMSYLVESGQAIEQSNYDTGGRPSVLYKYLGIYTNT